MIIMQYTDTEDTYNNMKDLKFVLILTDDGNQDKCSTIVEIWVAFISSTLSCFWCYFNSDEASKFSITLNQYMQVFWNHWIGVTKKENIRALTGYGTTPLGGIFGHIIYTLIAMDNS